eukprot:365081-Chlamydomonas_euryale.AAC.2
MSAAGTAEKLTPKPETNHPASGAPHPRPTPAPALLWSARTFLDCLQRAKAYTPLGHPALHRHSTPSPHTYLASSSSAPSACSVSSARTMVSAGGGASHSKPITLSTPRALSCITMPVRSERCISGTAVAGSSASKASSVVRR